MEVKGCLAKISSLLSIESDFLFYPFYNVNVYIYFWYRVWDIECVSKNSIFDYQIIDSVNCNPVQAPMCFAAAASNQQV